MGIDLKKYLSREVSNAPLIIFRILFGFMMTLSIIRFYMKGWVHAFYVAPKFHFSYFGFDWLPYPNEAAVYLLFILAFISSIGIMLGAFYRVTAPLFFLSFTYIELLDKTNYLNHYYLVSILAFLLIWLPTHRRFSIDARIFTQTRSNTCRFFEIGVLRFQIGLVYTYAGFAKFNTDWLLRAQPLSIWLSVRSHLPVLGYFFGKSWVAFFFSWFGAIYDTFITVFLCMRKTVNFAFLFVVAFHLLTALLFPIGLFPYIMIFGAIIFFPIDRQEKWLSLIESRFSFNTLQQKATYGKLVPFTLTLFLAFQLLFPWRYLAYPSSLFWTEEGFRFSWRVMLIEKAGTAQFYVTDSQTQSRAMVVNREFLTPLQEKMMATQPDMILQYAHFIGETYEKRGVTNPQVTADISVTLNGKSSKAFIDSERDLMQEEDSWKPKNWILKYD